MNRIFKTLILSICLLCSSFTFATPIIIDFAGPANGEVDELVYEQSGVTLTISAWTTSFNTAQIQLVPWARVTTGVSIRDGVLGVKSSNSDGSSLDGGSSSDFATDPDEGLLFTFSTDVDILDFFVTDLLDGDDDINFSVATMHSPTQLTTNDVFLDHPVNGPFDLVFEPSRTVGSAFMIWVDGGDDSVRLEDVAFIKVPEPAFLMLFGFVLILLRVRAN